MDKMFCLGLILGGIAGAWFVANNVKARELVKKSQDEAKTKIDAMIDEKLQSMNCQQSKNAQN